MFPLFESIGLIGLGLIGGSLARAIKKYNLARNIIGYTNSLDSSQKALEIGIINQISPSIQELVKNSNLVIISTPISSYGSILENINQAYDINQPILTDVGSLKLPVTILANKYLSKEAIKKFIPAHPIAGTEKTGVNSGFAELFSNKKTIITPIEGSDCDAIEKVKLLWTSCGSNIQVMNALTHDKVYAEVSHAPQFIAYCYATLLSNNKDIIATDIQLKESLQFRKFSRICASNPDIWIDIFMLNKANIFTALHNFSVEVQNLVNINCSDGLSGSSTMDSKALTQSIPKIISSALIKCSPNASYAGSGFADFTSYPNIHTERNEKSNKFITDFLFIIEQFSELVKKDERELAIDFIQKSVFYYKGLMGLI